MNLTKLNCIKIKLKQFIATHYPEDLQRSPCKRQTRKAKCEKKLWNAKTMKIDGKKMLISCMKFRMHESLLKTSSETEPRSESRERNRPTCRVAMYM